jgi:hypothetical protein
LDNAPQNAANDILGVGAGKTSRKIISTDGNLHIASEGLHSVRGAYRIDVFSLTGFARHSEEKV